MAHDIQEHDNMFSVRDVPWHRLGTVLTEDERPTSIDEAISRSGLGWGVGQGAVFAAPADIKGDPFERLRIADQIAGQYSEGGVASVDASLLEEYLASQRDNPTPPKLILAPDFRANIRDDIEMVLGIVSQDYKVVPNRAAFAFLDDLLGGDVLWETAGSLGNGKRVWALVRLPEYVEIAGDQTSTYIFVTNSHDGSMAVTAAATKVRIVCANTLGFALRQSEAGDAASRTYRFRHTGDLQHKYQEARKVMNMTIKWDERFKKEGDRLGTIRMSPPQFKGLTVKLRPIDTDSMTKRQVENRRREHSTMMSLFLGEVPGNEATVGNAPGSAWCALNAMTEFVDYHRARPAKDQIARSFEDTGGLKQLAYDLVQEAVA